MREEGEQPKPPGHDAPKHGTSARGDSQRKTRPNDVTVDRSTTTFGFASSDTSWVQMLQREVQAPATDGVVAGYQIDSEAHRGGQGVVYRAVDPRTGRHVALKLLHSGTCASEVVRERFERELQAVARLQHPNVVTVLGVEDFHGQPVLIFEWVDGLACDVWAQSEGVERRSTDEILAVVLDICDALQHAHGRGILHRDLKPTNILVRDSGKATLVDFGVVKFAENSPSAIELTQTRDFVGTPRYASPEQLGVVDREYDVRSEVYSLAIILFEMLTAKMPYDLGTTLVDVVRTIGTAKPRRLRELDPRASRELETILSKAMASEAERRYASIDAFAEDIRRFRTGQPIAALPPSALYQLRKIAMRNRLPVALVALLLLLAAGFTFFILTQNAQLRRQGQELKGKQVELVEQAEALRMQTSFAKREKAHAEAAQREAETSQRDVEATFAVLENVFGRLRSASEEGVDEAVAQAVREGQGLRPASQARLQLRLGQLLLSFHRGRTALTEFERCLATLDLASEEADRSADFARLRLEAHREAGSAARELAHHASSAKHFRAAIRAAQTLGSPDYDVLQLRIWLVEAMAKSREAGATEELERVRELVEATPARYWPNVELVAARMEVDKDFDGAARLYAASLTKVRRYFGRDSEQAAMLLDEIAYYELSRGRVDRARRMRERVAKICSKLGRTRDSLEIGNDVLLKGLLIGLGRVVDAQSLLARAAQLESEFARAENPAVLAALSAAGVALTRVGKVDDGLRYVRSAVDLHEERAGVEDLNLSNLLVHYAHALLTRVHYARRGGEADTGADLERAVAAGNRALRIRERLAPGHAEAAHALNVLGAASRLSKRIDDAERYYTRAIELLNLSYPREAEAHHVTRYNLVLALRDAGARKRERALEVNSEYLEIVRDASERMAPVNRYPAFFFQCELLRGLGRHEECLAQVKETLALPEEEVPAQMRSWQLRLFTLRATTLLALGRPDEAQNAWQRARERVMRSSRDEVRREFETCGKQIRAALDARDKR